MDPLMVLSPPSTPICPSGWAHEQTPRMLSLLSTELPTPPAPNALRPPSPPFLCHPPRFSTVLVSRLCY